MGALRPGPQGAGTSGAGGALDGLVETDRPALGQRAEAGAAPAALPGNPTERDIRLRYLVAACVIAAEIALPPALRIERMAEERVRHARDLLARTVAVMAPSP
ncbi:hypothetical protein ACIF9R_20595 [Streptomyces sp. NPDC086080]|uniref:hypothetical protein n=1 Tax=Streptomyces sp. NPDC086080 TaxID=3365748 RepID=UPI0037D4ADCE